MAESPEAPLDFGDVGVSVGATCGACAQPIEHAYFTLGTLVTCERCKTRLELDRRQRPGFSGVVKAVVFGSFWGLLGAAVWWGVRTFASLEIGLIAVAIGYFVGHAVLRASGGQGGRGFQVLAVALTYFWICANYVPDIAQAVMKAPEESPSPTAEAAGSAVDETGIKVVEGARADLQAEAGISADESNDSAVDSFPAAPSPGDEVGATSGIVSLLILSGLLFGVAMASPFLEGASNAIGLLIIGFGLLQAWQINRRVVVEFAGPFRIAPPSMSSSAPGASG